jgi:hypothetical protein
VAAKSLLAAAEAASSPGARAASLRGVADLARQPAEREWLLQEQPLARLTRLLAAEPAPHYDGDLGSLLHLTGSLRHALAHHACHDCLAASFSWLGQAALSPVRELLAGPPRPTGVLWTMPAERPLIYGAKITGLALVACWPQLEDPACAERLLRDRRESRWLRVRAGTTLWELAGEPALPVILDVCLSAGFAPLGSFRRLAVELAPIGPPLVPGAIARLSAGEPLTAYHAEQLLLALGSTAHEQLHTALAGTPNRTLARRLHSILYRTNG